MNILFVSGIYPPDIGGPATYVSRLAHELQNRGHGVEVLTLGEGDERLDKPFPVRKVPRGKSVALRCLRMFGAALPAGKRSDLIYATGSPWDSWIVSIAAAKILGKPLVFKVVGDPVWEWAQRRGGPNALLDDFNSVTSGIIIEILKRFRNHAARMADRIITPSAYLKNIVEKWSICSRKINVIYNAVEASCDQEISYENRHRELLTIGRLVPWKGMDGLIRIARLLPEDVRLVIVGDGPLEASLKEQAEKEGTAGKCVFTGRLPKKDVLQRLGRARVFALNSRYEGLPHTVLEAMASGAAVVCTDVGGNAEVIRDGKNGLLVPLGDEKKMADQIIRLFQDDGLRKRLSKKALHDSKGFSWDHAVAETVRLFQRVLG